MNSSQFGRARGRVARLLSPVLLGVAVAAVFSSSAAAAEPRIRKNQADLSSGERKAFVDAVLKMKKDGTYDPFVQKHIDAFKAATNPAHGGTAFLPWHRKFLFDFETELLKADVSGKLKGLPYWDWTVDNDATMSPFTADFLGGTGDPADKFKVKTGPFKAGPDWKIVGSATDQSTGDLTLKRRMGLTPDADTLPTRAQVTDSLKVTDYDAAPWNRSVDGSKSFRNNFEGWNPVLGRHNRVHVWVGGSMAISNSPDDPTFFLHHSQVDKIWAIWEEKNGLDKYPAAGPPAGQKLNDTMPLVGGTPKSVLDIIGPDLAPGYQYEVDSRWTKGAAGVWSDKAGWNIKNEYLLDQFPNNGARLLWTVELPKGGFEIKQDAGPVTINGLRNLGANLIVESDLTVLNDPKSRIPVRNGINWGTIEVKGGKTFTATGAFTNAGKFIDKGGVQTLQFTNLRTTKLDPAVFAITGTEPDDFFDNAPTGLLGGDGMVVGNVRNDGVVDPGTLAPVNFNEVGPGVINVAGAYAQGSTGAVVINIDGTGSQDRDKLAITGDGAFDGLLHVHFDPGFVPQAGDFFPGLITVAGVRSGDFAPGNVVVTGVQPGFNYTAGWDATGSFNLQALNNATAANPLLVTSPGNGGAVNFGEVRIGDAATAPLNVANQGDAGSLLKGMVTQTQGEFDSGLGDDLFLGAGQSSVQPLAYRPIDHGADADTVQVLWQGAPHSIAVSGAGVGPEFDSSVTPGGVIDFGELALDDMATRSMTIGNATLDLSTLESLTGLTILDVFLSQNEFDHFDVSGFTAGDVLGKGELMPLTLDFMAHDDVLMHMMMMDPNEEESHFFHPQRYGLKTAILNIVTDQNAAFGAAGTVFQLNLAAVIIPEPAGLLLGLTGIAIAVGGRRARRSGRGAG